VSFVVEELKAVFDPRGGYWVGGKYVPSLLAAIGGVIESHMIDTGFITSSNAMDGSDRNDITKPIAVAAGAEGLSGNGSMFRQCPKCAQPSLIRQEGCDTCTSCGHSKCG